MNEILTQLLDPLLDLIFPPKCEVCGELGRPAFCPSCLEQLIRVTPPTCRWCGVMLNPQGHGGELCADCAGAKHHYDAARCVGVHTGSLRRAVLNYKFNNCRRLEAPLAKLLFQRLQEEAEAPHGLPLAALEGVVPIPLHPSRRAWRGFDQAQRLCRKLGNLLDLPVVEGVLQRVKATLPQVQLTPTERRENMRGAFAVKGDAFAERTILLVDDVYTTGATADRAAEACRLAGAKAVYVLTISRPAPPWHPAALAMEPGEPDSARDQRESGN